MPRIPNYTAKGYKYPFLVTEHRLKDESTIKFLRFKVRSKDDMKFSKRTADRPKKNMAIIYAPGSYRILNE